MKNWLIAALFFAGFSALAQPSMTVSSAGNYNKPFWMAENILAGPGFDIFNLGHNGLPLTQASTNQIGYFQANDSLFPIQEGIVMVAAQYASDVIAASNGSGNNNITNDPELQGVLSTIVSSGTSYNLYDMVQIQFSFLAQSDSIKFNYVFGSHEYDGYTCSNFNDVFGFFIEGPYIDGVSAPVGTSIVKNIATIPGTSTPIAVNTINSGVSSSGNNTNCLAANPNFVAHSAYYNASNGSITTLDGYTDKFTAQAQVQCGQWYTIRLKLANCSDNALSSAVFLEEASLRAPSIAIEDSLNAGNSIADSVIVEGCFPTQIIFTKDGNVGTDMKIPLHTLGNAIEGVDYSPIPDTLFLPAGVASDTLFIQAYDDNTTELNDTLIVVMESVVTDCYTYQGKSMTYLLRDKDTLLAQITNNAPSDTLVCPGDSLELAVVASSSEGVIQGYWNHDPTDNLFNKWVQISSDTVLYFTAYDECGDTSELSYSLYLAPYTPMSYERDTVRVCPGDSTTFFPVIEGGAFPQEFFWSNGAQYRPRTFFSTKDTAYHTFFAVDGCGQFLQDSVVAINMPQPNAGFVFYNDPYVPLRGTLSERASNEVSYLWVLDSVIGTQPEFRFDFPRPGDYAITLVVNSAFGCVDTITLNVSVEVDYYLYVPTAFTPNNDGVNDCFMIKGVGFEGYEFTIFDRWGTPVFTTTNPEDCWDGTYNGAPLPTGSYSWRLFARLPFDKTDRKEGTLNLFR